jgi:transcriptional regulator with XRE-family HTH domain
MRRVLLSGEMETVQVDVNSYGRVVYGALLTKALKRLRQASGQQQKKVSDALEWSVSKLIRIENGSVRISRTDLEALLRYYNVTDQGQVDELIAWARETRIPGWWDRFKIQDKAFELYTGYESGATSIRMAQGLLVPGILQTEDYARFMTKTYAPPEQVDSVVLLRLERQKEVFARAPEQYHILDEAVLRRRVGDVMPDQLQRLVELAKQPKMTIRVIPFQAGPHFGLRGPFVLLGFDVPLDSILYLESARRGDLMVSEEDSVSGQGSPTVDDAAEEIARYEDGFEMLTEVALQPEDSIELIEEIARDMR